MLYEPMFRTVVIENIKIAFASFSRHKLRCILAVMGIIIGVITVMVVSSIISGIQLSVQKQIESSGTNSIFVTTSKNIEQVKMTRERRMRKPLSQLDAEKIASLSTIQASVPKLNISFNSEGEQLHVIGANGKSSNSITILGVHPSLAETQIEVLIEGRWFTEAENKFRKNVALINATVAEDYFPNEKRIGKKLKIDGREFQVVGVLEKRGQMFSSIVEPRKIYVPFRSALRIKPNLEGLYILAVAKPGQLESAKQQIEDLLRIRHNISHNRPNDFQLSTAEGRFGKFKSISYGIFLLMIIISSIALFVSGIGVMNIMLVSVTERTTEIGIRKTVGARNLDILIQFLTESVILTGVGGSLGFLFGWLLTFLISLVFPSNLPLWAPVVGFVASTGIGLVFGIFPAWKAARLNPIQAIRFE